MERTDLKAFRKANNITQDELGAYLGIKKSFVSHIESGTSKFPDDKYTKLLNNDMGWDVSMLIAGDINVSGRAVNNINVGTDTAILQAKIEMLEQQLAEEKARSSEYWELLKDAIKKSRE